MDQILKQITDLISGIFDSPIVQLGLRAIAIYIVILWLAGAYWAFRDMQLRTANPILPYFAASLVIIFTPVFFPFAIIAYRIVRPQEKIGEVYERTLAEEALLAEVEAVKSCPTCARRVDEEWIICPTCRTRLNRVCPNCSRLVGLDWSLCAWCGRDFEPAAPALETLAAHRPASSLSGEREAVLSSRSAMSPALEATAYRSPAFADDDDHEATPVRSLPAQAAGSAGSPGSRTTALEPGTGAQGRSLQRAAARPTAVRSVEPSAGSPGRATVSGEVKASGKAGRTTTDPLPER